MQCTLRIGLPLLALATAAPAATLPAIDVYIPAGQSNMSGRGALSDLSADERAADPAIRLYGNDGVWRAAQEPLDVDSDRADRVSADARAAVGPGLFFARAVRIAPGRRIGLVPCAKGGSAMREWTPGGGRETLYGSCIARIRAAGGRPAGILWYQGETDARDAAGAAQWPARFASLVDAFRRDLHRPALPVVLVTLADRPAGNAAAYPAWGQVRRGQEAVAMRHMVAVPAAGLSLLPDGLHLDTAAQRVLGTRLARAMEMLHADRAPARPRPRGNAAPAAG